LGRVCALPASAAPPNAANAPLLEMSNIVIVSLRPLIIAQSELMSDAEQAVERLQAA
jgi:hypothetical protein